MAKRTPKKAPAKAGAGRDIFDGHDRAEEARHVAALYAILPSDWTDPGAGSLPGLYRRQRALALEYLAPVAHVLVAEQEALRASLTPSQQAALALLEAVDRLLAAGAPDTDHKREWVRRVQAAAVLAHGRLHASDAAKARHLHERQRAPRNTPAPEWHHKAVSHAKLLLATGTESHELTAKCARKFAMSPDAVRVVLQRAGLVPKRKAAPSK